MKIRKAKGKGEKERYTHLNAEFQRIAWRHKEAFLSEQCKEREEKSRMGKTSDFLKKIRNIKGLDLTDRVPDELRTAVHDIIQEAVIKTIPKKNKC